jgi:hypothetical protein
MQRYWLNFSLEAEPMNEVAPVLRTVWRLG